MIPIFHREYKYAPIATFFSFMCSLASVCLLLLAAWQLGRGWQDGLVSGYVWGVVLLIAAGFSFFYLSRTFSDKLGKKETEKNIRTKAKFAYMFCMDHPEACQELMEINPVFSEKYRIDEKGRLIKTK